MLEGEVHREMEVKAGIHSTRKAGEMMDGVARARGTHTINTLTKYGPNINKVAALAEKPTS